MSTLRALCHIVKLRPKAEKLLHATQMQLSSHMFPVSHTGLKSFSKIKFQKTYQFTKFCWWRLLLLLLLCCIKLGIKVLKNEIKCLGLFSFWCQWRTPAGKPWLSEYEQYLLAKHRQASVMLHGHFRHYNQIAVCLRDFCTVHFLAWCLCHLH